MQWLFGTDPVISSVLESWRRDLNEVRPHSSLKGRSPKEYAEAVAALY